MSVLMQCFCLDGGGDAHVHMPEPKRQSRDVASASFALAQALADLGARDDVEILLSPYDLSAVGFMVPRPPETETSRKYGMVLCIHGPFGTITFRRRPTAAGGGREP